MKFNWKKFDWFLLPAAFAIGLACCYPGDIPWAGDEAQLVSLALQGNSSAVWAPHGLIGTAGGVSGALIVWLNQILLRFTGDPVALASVKCILSLTISSGALLWMSRTFRTPVGPGAALFFCSPYVFLYSRMCWDNVWLLPLGMMFAAFAAAYFRSGRIRYASGAALFLAGMVYVHPVSSPVPVAFAVAILVFRFKEFKQEWWKLLLVGAGALLLLSPYFIQCILHYKSAALTASPASGKSLSAALEIGRNLTAFGFSDRFAPESGLSLPGTLVIFSIPVIAFFLILGGVTVVRRYRRGELTAFDRTAGCALIALLLYFIMILTLRLDHQAHYNSAVTFASLLLAWRGFCVFREDHKRYAEIALGAAMLLQVVFLADFAFLVHRNSGGGSDYFGTTLANQWIVAKSLAAAYRANPGIKVDIQAERFRNDSFGLAVLIALARQTGLPQPPPCSEAIVLPARRGYGIDLILFEQPFLPDQEKDAAGI